MDRYLKSKFEKEPKNFPVGRRVWENDFQVIKISMEQGAHFVLHKQKLEA